MANTTNLDLVKPLGTDHALVSVINSNMDKIDAYAGSVNGSLNSLGDGLAIIANGDTHAAITSGQFVYVRGHNTLAEGLYTATSNISANGTLSGSNLTADTAGGLNALNSNLAYIKNPSRYATSSESDLKTYLLNVANGMSMGESRAVFIVTNVSSIPHIVANTGYEGYLFITYKSATELYFIWSAHNATCGDVEIGYSNGTWKFDSLNSKVTNVSTPSVSPNTDYCSAVPPCMRMGNICIVSGDMSVTTNVPGNGTFNLGSGYPNVEASAGTWTYWGVATSLNDGKTYRINVFNGYIRAGYTAIPTGTYTVLCVYYARP